MSSHAGPPYRRETQEIVFDILRQVGLYPDTIPWHWRPLYEEGLFLEKVESGFDELVLNETGRRLAWARSRSRAVSVPSANGSSGG